MLVWLRKHGVRGPQPLHALRKEYGSQRQACFVLTFVIAVLGEAQRLEPRGIGIGRTTVALSSASRSDKCPWGIEKDLSASVHSEIICNTT